MMRVEITQKNKSTETKFELSRGRRPNTVELKISQSSEDRLGASLDLTLGMQEALDLSSALNHLSYGRE